MKKHKLIFFYFNSNELVFPFQEECFNPSFPLFVTRTVMTPSTLFPRHAFQIRLCQLPPRPNCAFVYLKNHQMIGRPTLHRMTFVNPAQMAVDAKSVTTPTCMATTLHRMTGPLILNPILRRQKFHSSGVPYHRVYTKETKQTKKEKSSVQGCSGIGTKKQKIKIDFLNIYLFFVVSSKWQQNIIALNFILKLNDCKTK